MLPVEIPTIESAGVRLRPFRESDAPLVASVASDPLIPLITTVPTSGSPEDVAAYIRRQHDRLTDGAGYSFAVADRESDRGVGQIGLWTSQIDQGRASTGYWIAREHRGRGYARMALAALADWAFTLPEVARLELYVEPRNEASWRTAEACGFQREGLLRSWQRVGDRRRDMYMYSRLAHHLPQRTPPAS